MPHHSHDQYILLSLSGEVHVYEQENYGPQTLHATAVNLQLTSDLFVALVMRYCIASMWRKLLM